MKKPTKRIIKTRHSTVTVVTTPGQPDHVAILTKANTMVSMQTRKFTKKEQIAYDHEQALKENAERDNGTYLVRKVFESVRNWSPA